MAELKRTELTVRQEKALLVGAILRSRNESLRAAVADPLAELESLARTAAARVVGRVQQKLNRIDPAYYIGRGKAAQIGDRARELDAETIIFDNDLSPAQIRDLEEVTGCKILDRSELILDIFATRARTHQARLAVELAQLEYTFPRLRRMWTHLDTVVGGASTAVAAVGGIGTRGPGETQIETDRRLVRKRIGMLKRKLQEIQERRSREVKARCEQFTVSLVGYTNAGKSSLMNALTGADAFVEDKLFATLDTKTRQWKLAPGRTALLSDTVGFVRDLPHHLIESFKATLEEATHADLLLHVVDVSSPDALAQVSVVDRVLAELGLAPVGGGEAAAKAGDLSGQPSPPARPPGPPHRRSNGDGEPPARPIVLVLNKVDALEDLSLLHVLLDRHPTAVATSARTGRGLAELGERVLSMFQGRLRRVRVSCPVSDGRLISFIESHAEQMHERRFEGLGAQFEATMAARWLDRIRQWDGLVTVEQLEEP
ncbi:MAG: GTPase HflX [Phycisphaerae bacterium]|nr:GTPase HflX [Phycisphaerae bacterium]